MMFWIVQDAVLVRSFEWGEMIRSGVLQVWRDEYIMNHMMCRSLRWSCWLFCWLFVAEVGG